MVTMFNYCTWQNFQSRNLQLEAICSPNDGGLNGEMFYKDVYPKGIFVRANFNNELGKQHIPIHYSTTFPNSPTILVKRYTWNKSWNVNYNMEVDLLNPDEIIESSNGKRIWKYDFTGHHKRSIVGNKVVLTFLDAVVYDTILGTANSSDLSVRNQILENYDKDMRVELEDHFFYSDTEHDLFFFIEWDVEPTGGGTPFLFTEFISRKPSSDELIRYAWERFDNLFSNLFKIGENYRYCHFRCQNVKPKKLLIGAYQYFNWYSTMNGSGIIKHKFEKRLGLTNSSNVPVPDFLELFQKDWPRFVNDDGSNFLIFLKESYDDKWEHSKGLKLLRDTFLDLYQEDRLARKAFESDESSDALVQMSLKEIIELASMDFHIARLFNLAFIDNFRLFNVSGNQYFIYDCYSPIANEYNDNPVKEIHGKYIAESYMTPPIKLGFNNQWGKPIKFPHNIEIDKIDYGALARNSNDSNDVLTDENGYSFYEKARYINIHIKTPLEPELYSGVPDTGFTDKFNFYDFSGAALFGIRFSKDSGPWQIPEVLKDYDYPTGLSTDYEVIPLAFNKNPLFTHKVTEEGVYKYQVYCIDWFSLTSRETLHEMSANMTEFPERGNLLPPHNLSARYIQHEQPLMLTSAAEQTILQDRETTNPNDPNFLRITFDWNHKHNISFTKRENKTIRLFFNDTLPESRQGIIESVTESQNSISIQTNKLAVHSQNDAYDISPEIRPAEKVKFIGGYFHSSDRVWRIIDIVTGTNPQFMLEKIIDTKAELLDVEAGEGKNEYVRKNISIIPETGEQFFVKENTKNTDNWSLLNKIIQITDFDTLDPYTEEVENEDGSITELNIGGVVDEAQVEKELINNEFTGLYKITFDNFELPVHPQQSEGVSYYNGIVRVLSALNEVVELQVTRMDETGSNKLILYAFNTSENNEIQNANYTVNYHPSYKVYLYPENESNIEKQNIQPEKIDETKETFIAVQAIFDATGSNIKSELSSGTVITAYKIPETKIPGKPLGPIFATRPDFYGKATYTFDTEVDISGGREPYSLIFYRGNGNDVLHALYKEETIETILNELKSLEDDELFTERWEDLVNVVTENDEYKVYDGYGFPNPDNVENGFDGLEKPGEIVNKIKEAIAKSFLPLMPDPAIYKEIDPGYYTEYKLPKLRDEHFVRLPLEIADPYPNIRVLPADNSKVRFTDYSLDGSASDFYFYFVLESTPDSILLYDKISEISGPVQLVNSSPAKPPAIKEVNALISNTVLNQSAGIEFKIEPYNKAENIKKIRVYRTTSKTFAQNVRLMEFAGDFEIDHIIDDFSEMDFPPFEEILYYRLVALRQIQNEQNEEEWIPSVPGDIIETKIIDALNPPAPQIELHNYVDTTDEWTDIKLKWNKTVHNGSYHLYKMTESGNWQIIHTVVNNDAEIIVELANTELNSDSLPKKDEEDENIYHNFKVIAENASGLLSIEELMFTIGEGVI